MKDTTNTPSAATGQKKETVWRLEYNHKQGMFNYANPDDGKEETFGWQTINYRLSNDKCNEFVFKMLKKYKNINTGNGRSCPQFQTILSEYFEQELNIDPKKTTREIMNFS